MSGFKPGDKVRDGDREVTIVTIPFAAHWVRGENGKEEISPVGDLKPIPPADPRVDVVAEVLQSLDGDAALAEEHHRTARAVLAALDAETDGPLIQVGWYCWRGSGHLAAMACRSDSVPLYAPKEWEKEMREVMDDE